jgi:hypothetical protein
MNNKLRQLSMGLVLMVCAHVALAQGWGVYNDDKYGFAMLMPVGTVFAEREFGDGWAELFAEHDGVKFYALTKLGTYASPEEIEALGVKLTGISGNYWKQINSGKGENGWTWFRTVEAGLGERLVFGDYGLGPRGSYLIVVDTTETDYRHYKSDYKEWYRSIRLY